jgi:hypothetical protein
VFVKEVNGVTSFVVIINKIDTFLLEIFVFVTDSPYAEKLSVGPFCFAGVKVCRCPVQISVCICGFGKKLSIGFSG